MSVGAKLNTVLIAEGYRRGSVTVVMYVAGVSEIEMLGVVKHINKINEVFAVFGNICVELSGFI